jgi:hypothetical protein
MKPAEICFEAAKLIYYHRSRTIHGAIARVVRKNKKQIPRSIGVGVQLMKLAKEFHAYPNICENIFYPDREESNINVLTLLFMSAYFEYEQAEKIQHIVTCEGLLGRKDLATH